MRVDDFDPESDEFKAFSRRWESDSKQLAEANRLK